MIGNLFSRRKCVGLGASEGISVMKRVGSGFSNGFIFFFGVASLSLLGNGFLASEGQ
jgi:hypothetical protein